jgi:hypothetical protein
MRYHRARPAVILCTAGALALTGAQAAHAAGLTGTATDPAAAVSVDTAHPSGRLPADFVGLSFEMRELGIGNLDPRQGNLAALLRTLGRGNLRIGGNTLDRDTLWVPAGQQPPDPLPDWVKDVVTANDIRRLAGFVDATGWRAEVGINVGRWDPVAAADQAHAMTSILGDRLLATECGNEPDQWVGKGFRPAGYAYADYQSDWEACAAVVGNRNIAGPDTASPTSSWAASLAKDERANGLTMLTAHQYSMDPTGTAARLLSPATKAAQAGAAAPNLAVAQALHLAMRFDETNSAYGGGIDGVSNTHAAALWSLDYSLQLAQLGLSGINFHGGLGVCNQPIWNGKWQLYTPVCANDTADEAAQVYHAMPIYYGIWMARQMGPGSFLPLTLSTDRNVDAYAVRGDDGRLRIALVEKDDVTVGPVQISLDLGAGRGRGTGTAEVLRLTGSALSAADTAVQGATVDRSGRLRPGRPDLVRVHDGSLRVNLAGGSAAIVTLDAECWD